MKRFSLILVACFFFGAAQVVLGAYYSSIIVIVLGSGMSITAFVGIVYLIIDAIHDLQDHCKMLDTDVVCINSKMRDYENNA